MKIHYLGTCSGYKPRCNVLESEMQEGKLFADENVCVTALHNRHLGEDGTEGFHSYSFLIEAEGKR